MSRLRRVQAGLGALSPAPTALAADLDGLRVQLGGLESRHVALLGADEITRSEFRVFSQFGEDGMIQFLVQRVLIENEVFVEFGVENYHEANTRFLLVHDNWRGLILDGGDAMHGFLESTELAWRHSIDAVTAFVDRDNINGLIRAAGIEGDIGLLSIDIDGNDYWVLEAIDVVSPRIVVCEYNSVFGASASVTVPYDPAFVRSEKHWSWLYSGASLRAMADLADRKGYALVGGNRAGNNAFFVRRDVLADIPEVSVEAAYVESRFRESRNPDGGMSYVMAIRDRLALMSAMPLVDLESGTEVTISERFGV